MKILVTGGAGFIGSHLSERLLRHGHKLACIDDFNDYYSPAIKRSNMRSVLVVGKVKVWETDIRDRVRCKRAFASFRPDCVVHLAARAGVRPSLEDPVLYDSVNCSGTINLLELCREYGVGKFVFGSSSSVYGNSPRVPFREDDPAMEPISPYGATKRAGELYCYNYHKLHGISFACLRFFTVYGPRQRPDMAIHKFARIINEGRPVPMFGDGSTKRDYTFYSDIVSGIEASIALKRGFEIINLGNSNTVRLKYLIELIGSCIGVNPVIKRMPKQAGDVERTYADISKARRLLGFRPEYPIEKGVAEFARWFKARITS